MQQIREKSMSPLLLWGLLLTILGPSCSLPLMSNPTKSTLLTSEYIYEDGQAVASKMPVHITESPKGDRIAVIWMVFPLPESEKEYSIVQIFENAPNEPFSQDKVIDEIKVAGIPTGPPFFSSDGNKLIFSAMQELNLIYMQYHFYIYDLITHKKSDLIDHYLPASSNPWSPDESRVFSIHSKISGTTIFEIPSVISIDNLKTEKLPGSLDSRTVENSIWMSAGENIRYSYIDYEAPRQWKAAVVEIGLADKTERILLELGNTWFQYFSPDGQAILFIISQENRALLYSLGDVTDDTTPKPVEIPPYRNSSIQGAVWTPDMKRLAVVLEYGDDSDKREIRLFNLKERRYSAPIMKGAALHPVGWSSDGKLLYVSGGRIFENSIHSVFVPQGN